MEIIMVLLGAVLFPLAIVGGITVGITSGIRVAEWQLARENRRDREKTKVRLRAEKKVRDARRKELGLKPIKRTGKLPLMINEELEIVQSTHYYEGEEEYCS